MRKVYFTFALVFLVDFVFFRNKSEFGEKRSAPTFRFVTTTQLMSAGSGHLSFSVPLWVFSKDHIINKKVDGEDSLPDSNDFKAQKGEDIYAMKNFFHNYDKGGIILESGALDGVTYSTSWAFEKALGWKAIHIEANPLTYSKLVQNRPDALNINVALCREPQTLHLIFDEENGAVGGIWEYMAESHKEIFWKNINVDSLPSVMCMPLAPLLQLFDISHVNFWVLDVEGAELEVLRATDFERVTFDVIAMEIGSDFEKDAEATFFLKGKDYTVFDSIGPNRWFVHRNMDLTDVRTNN